MDSIVTVRTAEAGDFLGQTALTREPVAAGAHALDEVTVLQIDRAARRGTRRAKAAAASGHHGRTIEERRSAVRAALAASTKGVTPRILGKRGSQSLPTHSVMAAGGRRA